MFDATEEGPSCPHPDGVLQAEDCLRLNVYTTKVNKRTQYITVTIFKQNFNATTSQYFHLFIYYFFFLFLATVQERKCNETGYDIHTSRRFYQFLGPKFNFRPSIPTRQRYRIGHD